MGTPPAKPDIPQEPVAAAEQVLEASEDLGFVLIGVVRPAASGHTDYVRSWLAAGHHGEMDYLARHLEARLDPEVLLPGARAMICVADRYPPAMQEDHPQHDRTKPAGRIARYAWGDDYHKVLKKRLHRLADRLREKWPGHDFKAAVDTAPILEHEHAHRAGLGWVGKHTLLINPAMGSWLLLGQIVTTLPIEPSEPDPTPDHCGTCTRCIDACPTGCIEPYRVDASQCVSYLTIEHRGMIDPELHTPMGDWIAGCDVCQEVCPFNQPDRLHDPQAGPRSAIPPHHPRYEPRPPAPGLDLLEVLGWSTQDRRRTFKNSALKRIKLDMLKRNALIAAGNHLRRRDDLDLYEKIRSLVDDPAEPDVVRDTACRVLAELKDPAAIDHGAS